MTALTITAIIAITIVGLLLLAELGAITYLLFRVSSLAQQVRDRINPVVDQSTQILHKVNDVTDTVKTDTRKIADKVTDVTEHLAAVTDKVGTRIDSTSATMQTVTTAATARLTSPPVLTAIALFAGLSAAASLRRLASWPLVTAITLFSAIPVLLRAWRSLGRPVTTTTTTTATTGGEAEVSSPLLLRPRVDEEPVVYPRAA